MAKQSKRLKSKRNFSWILRPFCSSGTQNEEEKAAIKGKGIDQMEDLEAYKPFGMRQDTKKKLRSANDKTLIDYFYQLGQSRDPNAKVDLDFVDSLIKNGANINCNDKHGQTLLHEVGCLFLKENKVKKINLPRQFKRDLQALIFKMLIIIM